MMGITWPNGRKGKTKNMFKKLNEKLKRFLAFLLSVVMIVTNVQVPTFAEEKYDNFLDGWKVQCAWSNLTTDYTWNADRDETRQPKIVFTYRLENAEKITRQGASVFPFRVSAMQIA